MAITLLSSHLLILDINMKCRCRRHKDSSSIIDLATCHPLNSLNLNRQVLLNKHNRMAALTTRNMRIILIFHTTHPYNLRSRSTSNHSHSLSSKTTTQLLTPPLSKHRKHQMTSCRQKIPPKKQPLKNSRHSHPDLHTPTWSSTET